MRGIKILSTLVAVVFIASTVFAAPVEVNRFQAMKQAMPAEAQRALDAKFAENVARDIVGSTKSVEDIVADEIVAKFPSTEVSKEISADGKKILVAVIQAIAAYVKANPAESANVMTKTLDQLGIGEAAVLNRFQVGQQAGDVVKALLTERDTKSAFNLLFGPNDEAAVQQIGQSIKAGETTAGYKLEAGKLVSDNTIEIGGVTLTTNTALPESIRAGLEKLLNASADFKALGITQVLVLTGNYANAGVHNGVLVLPAEAVNLLGDVKDNIQTVSAIVNIQEYLSDSELANQTIGDKTKPENAIKELIKKPDSFGQLIINGILKHEVVERDAVKAKGAANVDHIKDVIAIAEAPESGYEGLVDFMTRVSMNIVARELVSDFPVDLAKALGVEFPMTFDDAVKQIPAIVVDKNVEDGIKGTMVDVHLRALEKQGKVLFVSTAAKNKVEDALKNAKNLLFKLDSNTEQTTVGLTVTVTQEQLDKLTATTLTDDAIVVQYQFKSILMKLMAMAATQAQAGKAVNLFDFDSIFGVPNIAAKLAELVTPISKALLTTRAMAIAA